MSLWFSSSFGVPPVTMFSWPFSYNPGVLPPFYSSLLSAWQSLNGSFSPSHNSLAFGVGLPLVCTPVAGMSTKSCYLYLLSENMVQPHCVDKFSFTFSPLDWPAAWCPLSFLDVDRQVTDLNWKLAHNMLYTAQRLASFGLPVPLPCFCGSPMESLGHLFFYCPLAHNVLSWLQSLFSFSFMCPALLVCHVRFGFGSDELCATPRVFVFVFVIWQSRNDFRFRHVPPGAIDVIPKVKARLKCHLRLLQTFPVFSPPSVGRHRQWGARGVVPSVSGNRFTIAL